MPLTLSEHDLADFRRFLMRNCRGEEISVIEQWLNQKLMQQGAGEEAKRAAEAKKEQPAIDAAPTKPNGHAANPYPAPPA